MGSLFQAVQGPAQDPLYEDITHLKSQDLDYYIPSSKRKEREGEEGDRVHIHAFIGVLYMCLHRGSLYVPSSGVFIRAFIGGLYTCLHRGSLYVPSSGVLYVPSSGVFLNMKYPIDFVRDVGSLFIY